MHAIILYFAVVVYQYINVHPVCDSPLLKELFQHQLCICLIHTAGFK